MSFSDCLFHAPSPLLSHHSQRAQGEVGRPCPPLCAAISRTSGRQTGRGLGKRACQELGFVGQWNRFPEGKVCDCRERALAAACEWSRRNPPREESPVRGRPKGSPTPLGAWSLPPPSRYECTLTLDGGTDKELFLTVPSSSNSLHKVSARFPPLFLVGADHPHSQRSPNVGLKLVKCQGALC